MKIITKRFMYRLGNIELHSCDENLTQDFMGKPHTTAEIVQIAEKGNNTWTIVSWERNTDSYTLKFVGLRPLDERIDWNDFKELIKVGQGMLDKLID